MAIRRKTAKPCTAGSTRPPRFPRPNPNRPFRSKPTKRSNARPTARSLNSKARGPCFTSRGTRPGRLAKSRGKLKGKALLSAVREVLKLPRSPKSAPDYRIWRYLGSRGYPTRSGIAYAVETEPGIEAIVYRLSDERLYSRPPKTGPQGDSLRLASFQRCGTPRGTADQGVDQRQSPNAAVYLRRAGQRRVAARHLRAELVSFPLRQRLFLCNPQPDARPPVSRPENVRCAANAGLAGFGGTYRSASGRAGTRSARPPRLQRCFPITSGR